MKNSQSRNKIMLHNDRTMPTIRGLLYKAAINIAYSKDSSYNICEPVSKFKIIVEKEIKDRLTDLKN